MNTRIEDVPKLRTVPTSLNAQLYNTALLAILRLETPLRIRLPGLRTIDAVLSKNSWVCLDRAMYDLPALAWTNINQGGRVSLHTPIECELSYYHIHANISASKVLNSLHAALEEALANAVESSQLGTIIPFPQVR